MRILTATVDVVPVNKEGKLLMLYNKQFEAWDFPGGHVEGGMSWGEAATQELLEEGCLEANPEDLIPFATVSGGGYIYHYQDGTTQPFSVVYTVREFREHGSDYDPEEIAEAKWVTVEEAQGLPKTLSARNILPAYQEWLETGQFQQVVV